MKVYKTEFAALVTEINAEIDQIKKNTAAKQRGKTGVRFLKHVSTRLKVLAKDVTRVSKKKKTSTRTNTNSGFMKPVEISSEMRKFTGWDAEPKSRVQVTKYICDYIKNNDLQNPADRRQIRPKFSTQKASSSKGRAKGSSNLLHSSEAHSTPFCKEECCISDLRCKEIFILLKWIRLHKSSACKI